MKAQTSGCTDTSADNYFCNTLAGQTGGCVMTGFDPFTGGPVFSLPPGFSDDGSCQFSGCTNPNADNYDPNANLDNGQ